MSANWSRQTRFRSRTTRTPRQARIRQRLRLPRGYGVLSVRRHPKGDTASRGTPRKPGRSSRPPAPAEPGSHKTPPWREMDSNSRSPVSGDTPQRPLITSLAIIFLQSSASPSHRRLRPLRGKILASFSVYAPCKINAPPEAQESYLGSRGNGTNPSRFGIFTLGSDCASSTSSVPTTPLRLRM